MRSFRALLNLACILAVKADGTLRGSNAMVEQDDVLKAHNLHLDRIQRTLQSECPDGVRCIIIGDDDREEFLPSSFPWTAVGKVQSTEGSCTGTMIGPKLMITAQHCIPHDPNSGAPSEFWLRFVPAYYDGETPFTFADAETRGQFHWDREISVIDGKISIDDGPFDYMVVELNWPIGYVVGWWDFQLYQREWDGQDMWLHVGYPSDVANAERPIRMKVTSPIISATSYFEDDKESYILRHAIDVIPGQSGGPVFTWLRDDTRPVITGVQSSDNPEDWNRAAGGPAMDSLISNLRSRFG